MHTYKYILFFIMFVTLAVFIGCNKNDNPSDPSQNNESEILVKYLEANGDYINTLAPVLISAEEVREGQLNNAKQVIFDIRASCDYYTKGHINGAVLITLKDIPAYYRNHSLDKMDKVIITCGTGQAANYAAALLRLYGYNNIYAMNFGMTSWNPACDSWSAYLSDIRASQFQTTGYAKNKPGDLPELSTGKTTGAEILSARVEEIMKPGFNYVQASNENLFLYLDEYYIINFCPYEQYLSGHVPNAVNYIPGQDLKLETFLKTIPADRTVVVYCSTGQTSAQAAAFLSVLGYDARSVLYGNNGMNYSSMTGKKFSSAEIHDYPVVH
jgi:rhodanese-related sulfurtransferase